MSASSALAMARTVAAARMPYFTGALLRLAPVPRPGLGTLATSARGVMLYDPVVVVKWSMEELAGVLVHELLHVLLGHHERLQGADQFLANLAMDLAINPMIQDARLKLPPVPALPEQFGFPNNETAEWYYHELLKLKSKGKDQAGGKEPGVGRGQCGGCAGNPHPDEKPENAGGEKQREQEARAARSDAELAQMRNEAAARIQESSKQAGRVPLGLERWAGDQLKPARVPWQQKLARAVRGAVSNRAGMGDYSYSRPSRRHSHSAGPGMPLRPSTLHHVPRVAVVLDTSGSMGNEEVAIGVSETRAILLNTGATVEFMSCDAQVHALATVRRWQDILGLVKGGGGTDFRPAFEALESLPQKPSVIVFITDGYGPAPECPPSWARVIWLLVGHGAQRPCAWGEAIELAPKDQR